MNSSDPQVSKPPVRASENGLSQLQPSIAWLDYAGFAGFFLAGYLVEGPVLGGLLGGLCYGVVALYRHRKKKFQAIGSGPDDNTGHLRLSRARRWAGLGVMIFPLIYPIAMLILRSVTPSLTKGWLELIQPLTDFFGSFMPAFDAAARRMVRERRGDGIQLVHNVMAVEWAATLVFCALYSIDIWCRRKMEWSKIIPRTKYASEAISGSRAFIYGLFFVGGGVAVMWLGFGFEFGQVPPFLARDAYIPMIGVFFALFPGGWMFMVAAIITGNLFHRNSLAKPLSE